MCFACAAHRDLVPLGIGEDERLVVIEEVAQREIPVERLTEEGQRGARRRCRRVARGRLRRRGGWVRAGRRRHKTDSEQPKAGHLWIRRQAGSNGLV